MKTGTVMNSVHQINTRCLELIKRAEDLPYIDVGIAANDLSKKCEEMLNVFDKTPDAYDKLVEKKRAAEFSGVRLEYLLNTWTGDYEEVVALRVFADKLYNDTRAIFSRITRDEKTADPRDAVEWGHRCKWTLQFYEMSKHALFETDEDDDEKIKEITRAIKGFYEVYGER